MKEDEEIAKYLNILTSFYEKTIASHPKKESLRQSFNSWKKDVQSQLPLKFSQDDDNKTVKTLYNNPSQKRPSSPVKTSTMQSIDQMLPDYQSFMFKDDNDFQRVFSYSFIISTFSSLDIKDMKSLLDQVNNASTFLEGTAFAQNVAIRKITFLITYLTKAREKCSAQDFRQKVQTIAYEDKTILSRIVKLLIMSRKQNCAQILTQTNPSESSLKSLAEILNIRLTMFQVSEKDFTKVVYGKNSCEVIIAYDKQSSVYINLIKRASPALNRTLSRSKQEAVDKAALFNDILSKINANSQQLMSLKCFNKPESWQDITIKEKLKKFVKKT